jgi:hypothetical protein
MMDTREVRVGQDVRVTWLHRDGTVMEVDREHYAARVVFASDQAEHWARLQDLEPVIPGVGRR